MTLAARSAWIDNARAVQTETILRQRGILDKLKGRKNRRVGPCPICGGRDRFSVNLRKGSGGVFFCRVCNVGGGDAISLTMFLDQCSFLEAVETLVGPPPDSRTKDTDAQREARQRRARELRERLEREAREAAELAATLEQCDQLSREAEPLPREAIIYFAKRKINIADVPDQGGLRWHPAMPKYINGPTRPSIIARFTDPRTGAPGGIWHRPLTGEKPRAFGPVKDRVIRLWPDDAITTGLVIGEGIETCLSAATRIVHRGTLLQPAWACACRTNVRDFLILPGIEHLTVLADHDASGHGQSDARACARRWADAGVEAEVLTPDKPGTDFNDLACEVSHD